MNANQTEILSRPHNRRAKVVHALARDVDCDARNALRHLDQVATRIVTALPTRDDLTEMAARGERLRHIALGVAELDHEVDAEALELMAYQVTRMLDRLAELAAYTRHIASRSPARPADNDPSASSSWPVG